MESLRHITSAVDYYLLCLKQSCAKISEMARKGNIADIDNKTQFQLSYDLAKAAENYLLNNSDKNTTSTFLNTTRRTLNFDEATPPNRTLQADRSQSNIVPSPITVQPQSIRNTREFAVQTGDDDVINGNRTQESQTDDGIIVDGNRTLAVQTDTNWNMSPIVTRVASPQQRPSAEKLRAAAAQREQSLKMTNLFSPIVPPPTYQPWMNNYNNTATRYTSTPMMQQQVYASPPIVRPKKVTFSRAI